MQVRTRALKMAGAAMIIVALAPWVGAGAANAAVTVYLDKKWDGTNSATANVAVAGCDYAEITDISHHSRGWHFVLPGGSGLTTFTANFATAGPVTVTTTDTANGVIVQGGKGAVVFTNGNDTLTNTAALDGYPGKGSAATKGPNDMQLSHLCGDGGTPPIDECTNIAGNQGEVPPGYTQNEDGTCSPVSSNPVTTTASNPVTTTATETGTASNPVTTTASSPVASANAVTTSTTAEATGEVSVLPTKVENTTADETAAQEDVGVEGTKAAAPLPHTGNNLPVTALVVLSLGLLLAGGSLLLLPGLTVEKGKRRH